MSGNGGEKFHNESIFEIQQHMYIDPFLNQQEVHRLVSEDCELSR